MSRKRDRKRRDKLRRATGTRSAARSAKRPSRQAVFETAAKKAEQTVASYLGRDDLAERVIELADATRGLALRVMQRSPIAGRHECIAGCACCCHTAVTIAPPEAFAIAKYLTERYSEQELQQVRGRMDENAALAARISREDYIARLIPCALLTEDGNCRAHPVRPMACAGFCSTSRRKCEAEFDRVVGREPVPVDKFTMSAGLAVSNGLLAACRNAGRDGNFYELHHALRRVLDTPDAARQWAAGRDVFNGCRR